jgi:putative transposase
MARGSRIDIEGALHHIIARGIERGKIFEDDQDRYDFLDHLDLIFTGTGTICYAWSLIPNHFHLLLKTGPVSISTVLQRILTGHAIRFNRRHKRHGHLFQNRYKSILCQADSYLLELVRYIHLNPLRAGLIDSIDQLQKYPFCGHGVIMGEFEHSWQQCAEVLSYFDNQVESARNKYKQFVSEGVDQGRRYDLTGGGLIRSSGGWEIVKKNRESKINVKGDERILGNSDFVSEMLSRTGDFFERRHALKAKGVDVSNIAEQVSKLLGIPVGDVWREGKNREIVKARSLLCFWAVRELGISMTEMARKLHISTVAVSKSVARGEDIAKEEGLELISKL